MSWSLCDTIYVHVIYCSMKEVAVKSLSLQVRQPGDKASIVQGHLVPCSIATLLFIEAEEAANMYMYMIMSLFISENGSFYLQSNIDAGWKTWARLRCIFNLGYLTSKDKCKAFTIMANYLLEM